MRRILAIGLAGVGAGLFWWFLGRGEQTPAWQRKKARREAKRAAARRAQEQAAARHPAVRVEKEGDTRLKVPLGDLTQ